MKVIKEKKFTLEDGTERMIQLGKSTWNDKELSLRFYYEDSRGRFCFKSPEVPLDVAAFMVGFMKEDISILPEEVVELLAKY